MAYRTVPSVYQIFLIDFDLFKEEGTPGGRKFFHRAMMRLDDGTALTDRLQILFFDLKVPGEIVTETAEDRTQLAGDEAWNS